MLRTFIVKVSVLGYFPYTLNIFAYMIKPIGILVYYIYVGKDISQLMYRLSNTCHVKLSLRRVYRIKIYFN